MCIVSGSDLSIHTANTIRPVYLAKGLKDIGYNVSLIVPQSKSQEIDYPLAGIDLAEVPIRMEKTLGSVLLNQMMRGFLLARKAKKMQENSKAIIQIEHSLLGGCAALVGCSGFVLDFRDIASMSPTFTSHPLSMIPKIIYRLEKLAASKAAKIITVSHSMKKKISVEFSIPEDKIEVIPPGFSEQKIQKALKVEEVEGRITFLGTLIKDIDYEKILALAQSLTDGENIYIVGDGEMRSFLEKQVEEHGLNNFVFTGMLPEEEAYLMVARSQVVILPWRETSRVDIAFPIKGLYYAALGKAIVMDDCEMARELKAKDAALVSDRGKPDEFIENIHTLLKNEELRRKIGSNARGWVKNFTWENQAKKLAMVYETLNYE